MPIRLFVPLALVLWIAPIASQPGGEAAEALDSEVRTSLNQYVEVFNAGDAEALAQFWTEDATYAPMDGDPIVGRKAILESYRQIFEDNPGVQMEIADSMIIPASEGWANESGISVLTYSDGSLEESPYEAVLKKVDERWLIQSVVDLGIDEAPPHYEYLKDLEWLIGTWKDEGEESFIETTYDWSSKKNSIVGKISVVVDGILENDGVIIFGWDPIDGNVRSWTFDSDGQTAEGSWYRRNGKWYSKSLYVLPDGRLGSSTRIFEKVDDNTLRWKAVNRMVDGEILPSVGPITLKRAAGGEEESK